MKKSEAILEMVNLLCLKEFQNAKVFDQANTIIKLCEKLGMIAPSFMPEPEYHHTGKQLELKTLNKWE